MDMESETIKEFLQQNETQGYSISGTYEEIIEEFEKFFDDVTEQSEET